jgi:putative CocE/NonD family hydrolase
MDFTYYMANANVPALHISGIWDGDEIGTHINWNTMRDLGRKDQWIVFGPWVHAFNTNKSFQDVQYGPDAIIDLDSVFLRWFDTWLKDKPVNLDRMSRVRLFVTGANKWAELPDWPAPSMKSRKVFLSNKGLLRKPGPKETRTYTYDPAKDNEIPKGMLQTGSETEGSTKVPKSSLDKMQVFSTEPFKKTTAIAAPFKLNLRFKTSAKDTDFFVTVMDVAPNGEMRVLGQHGKIRGSYLGGMDKVRALVPGKEYSAEVIPWDFAHEFKKGHRLAVGVNSTLFPAYARNLGTAEPIKNATKMVAQKNTILMGGPNGSSFSYYILWEK